MPDVKRDRSWGKTKEAQTYRNAYTRAHYDSVTLTVPKGFRQTIEDAAARAGVNKSQLIVRLITEYMEKGTD